MARWLGVPNRLIATIRFAANSSWLTATAMSKLRAAARWVRTNHVTKLTVTGFTEKHAHGSIVFRKYLSLQRARRARTYLLAQFAKIHIRVTIVAVGSGGAGKNLVSYRRVEVVANGFAPVPK